MSLIQFSGVCKSYHLEGGKVLLRKRLLNALKGLHTKRVEVLKSVSFSLERGQSLAIVGRNGAGKSTLLGIIAGVLIPDSGIAQVNGRVAALLELASGFHPDLNGRENVILNAALLGISRRRTFQLLDEILDFSGISHQFLLEPLHTYSSGMIMRLAFSVAINVDPDILLVDEVLAVGDAQFQEKCLHRIRNFRAHGNSLICVSHAPAMVQEFCDQAIWLEGGEIQMFGETADVLGAYKESMTSKLS